MKRLLLILLLALCPAHCWAVSLAHRTTATAPAVINFTAVDLNSAVRASSNITGVTFGCARNLTAAGTGSVAFVSSGKTIAYTAPGDTAGTPLALTANLQAVKLYSGNGVDWIYIDVTYASVPGSNQTDNITITSLRSTGVQQPTAVTDPGDPDYASQAYRWNFGDPYAITYSLTNGRNSNTCRGSPNTAHLFTRPGTYRVTLALWTVDGERIDYTEYVTISSPPNTIYYVDATGGNNANAGTNPAAPLQTLAAGLAKITGDNITVAFKRDETFSMASNATISNSNILITSYYNVNGTDDPTKARPAITAAPTSGNLFSSGAGIHDFKLCHLSFTGPGSGTSRLVDFGGSTATANGLAYDCYVTGFNAGITISGDSNNWGNTGLAIVACEVRDNGFTSAGNGIYCELHRGCILGSLIYDTEGGEHCTRVWGFSDSIIADSYFERPANTKHCLAVRGIVYGTVSSVNGLRFTSNTHMALLRNKTLAPSGSGIAALQIAPTSDSTDERLEHVIIDGHFSSASSANGPLAIGGRDLLFRNFVFKGPGSPFLADITSKVCPRIEWLRAYNGVADIDTSGATVPFMQLTGTDGSTARDVVNVRLGNIIFKKIGSGTHTQLWRSVFSDIASLQSDGNLCDLTSSSTRWSAYTPDGGSVTNRTLPQTQTDLSQDLHSANGTALFTNASSDDYSLQAGSAAIGLGNDALLPWVRFDALGNERTTDLDAGAFERGAIGPDAIHVGYSGNRLILQEQER